MVFLFISPAFEESSPQKLILHQCSSTEFKNKIYICVYAAYSLSGFSSMNRCSKVKASRTIEVLLSMVDFHGIFHSISLDFISTEIMR